MKKLSLLLLTLTVCFFTACHKDIWAELENLDQRVTKLEELCKEMNTNITSLQTIVDVLQSNDFITGVVEIKKDGEVIGYTITFGKHDPITIYHGQDGKDGADGKDGQDGQNGSANTPVIGVAQDTDGVYYWTLNGEWLLDDNGNKLPVSGKDGQNGTNGSNGQDGADGEDGKDGIDGQDGKDGITPQLKIEDGYWYISYDNGATWTQLGKATGEDGKDGKDGANGADGKDGQNGADGKDGQDGDSMFRSVTQDENYVYFTLADGTVIKIAKGNGEIGNNIITFKDERVKMLCVANWDINGDLELSHEEAKQITSLNNIFCSDVDIFVFNELQYFTGLLSIEDNAFKNCNNLCQITLPTTITNIGVSAFQSCKSLRVVTIPENLPLTKISENAFSGCEKLESFYLPREVRVIQAGAFYNCSSMKKITFESDSKLKVIENATTSNGVFQKTGLDSICIPKSVTTIGTYAFSQSKIQKLSFENGSNCKIIRGGVAQYPRKDQPVYFTDVQSCSGAFSLCTNLKEITIPAVLDTLNSAVFLGCTALTEVNFEENSQITVIAGDGNPHTSGDCYLPYGAFALCTSLKTITIPYTVVNLGISTFYGCSALEKVIFENDSKIVSLPAAQCSHSDRCCNTGCFAYCTSLNTIRFGSKTNAPYIGTESYNSNSSKPVIIFYGVNYSNITIEIPEGTTNLYSSWAKYFTLQEYYE